MQGRLSRRKGVDQEEILDRGSGKAFLVRRIEKRHG